MSSTDASVRQLLGELANEERGHEHLAGELEEQHLTPDKRAEEADTIDTVRAIYERQAGSAPG